MNNMNNIFNVDLVNAKSGKKLTKREKTINYIANLILTRLVQLSVIAFLIFWVATVVKFLLKVWA